MSWSPILVLAHLLGLALGLGAATVKLVLLLRCRADPAALPGYLAASKPVTRLIVLGMVLLTLSGIGWLVLGYPLTPRLVVKLVLVAALWVMGPVIDNVVEPRFQALAPAPGAPVSAAFVLAQNRFLAAEVLATSLFYAIVVVWVFRG